LRIVDGHPYPFPLAVSPIWVDVRDFAVLVAGVVPRPEVGNKCFIVGAPEGFSFQLEADILRETFAWVREVVAEGNSGEPVQEWPKADGETARKMLGLNKYRTFREVVVDSIAQFKEIQSRENPV
jgi:nucleoside-diphosphate-sugar epimerase